MGESQPDIDDLGLDDLKLRLVELVEATAALRAENAALREEIARLKGLKGPPKLKASGMERAKCGQAGGRRRQEPAPGQDAHEAGDHRGADPEGSCSTRLAVQGHRDLRGAGSGAARPGDPVPA